MTVQLPLQNLHSGKEVIYNTLNTKGWLGEPSSVMFRKSNLHVGPFKAGLIWLPDWEMWIRQLTTGDCYIISEPVVFIRNHGQQLTKKVMKYFINYQEEYELCKAIKENDGYNIDKSGIDMESVMKKRALNCAKAVYKLIPRLHKKQDRAIFIKLLKIAAKEKVLLAPLFKSVSGKKPQPILIKKETVSAEV